MCCLRGAASRLTGRHWDRGLTTGQRRALAARGIADEEEVREAWAALAAPSGSRQRGCGPGLFCTVLLDPRDPLLQSERTQGFTADPVYGRANCLPMLGEIKT